MLARHTLAGTLIALREHCRGVITRKQGLPTIRTAESCTLDRWHDIAPTSMYRAPATDSALTDDDFARSCRGQGSWTSCRLRGSPSHPSTTASPPTALPSQPLCPSWRRRMPRSLQIRCVDTLHIPAHASAVDVAAQDSHGMLCACSVGPTPTSKCS